MAGLLLLIGAALRFYELGAQPPGLYRDEAFYALDAAGVLEGRLALYFPANNGREPLFIYLMAASVGAFGHTPFAVRLPSAFIGLLTLAATYALGRALFTRRVGVLALGVAVSTFWPLALSRIGFRVGTLPLMAALSLACAAWGWRKHNWRWVTLGGVFYGLSAYTYLATRVTPLPLLALGIFWYIARHATFPAWRWFAAFALPAVFVAWPLGLYAAWQPAMFFGRAGQVSILNPAIHHGDFWGTLFHNLWATLGLFNWQGDTIPRHNLPGRPVFDLITGSAFLAGVGLTLWRALKQRHLPSALVLMWVGAMLTPTLIAENPPHFLRASGVLPLALLLPALGFAALPRQRFTQIGLALALALSLGLTTYDYFGRYAAEPTTGYAFEAAATALADDLNTHLAAGDQVYADQRYRDTFPAIAFLTAPDRVIWYEANRPPTLAPQIASALYVWPYSDLNPLARGLPAEAAIIVRPGPLAQGDLEPQAYALYTELLVQPASAISTWPLATFAGRFNLLHASGLIRDGQVIARLIWQATTPSAAAYQVTAQAWQNAVMLGQADGPLGADGAWPNPLWASGWQVTETRVISLSDPPPDRLTLLVALYDPLTGERLPRADQFGDQVEIEVP